MRDFGNLSAQRVLSEKFADFRTGFAVSKLTGNQQKKFCVTRRSSEKIKDRISDEKADAEHGEQMSEQGESKEEAKQGASAVPSTMRAIRRVAYGQDWSKVFDFCEDCPVPTPKNSEGYKSSYLRRLWIRNKTRIEK
eukprot:g20556.t1